MNEYDSFSSLEENFEKLSAIQQKALTLAIQGTSNRDISRECNIDESTFYKWMQSDLFNQCFSNWKYRLFDEVDTKMKKLYSKAVDKLESILDQEEIQNKELLKAIELILKVKNS